MRPGIRRWTVERAAVKMPHDIVTESTGVPHELVTQLANPSTRREVLRALGQRYRAATRAQKSRILDEVVAKTGCHRKHAVRLLRRGGASTGRALYGDAEREALAVAWEASGHACGKRLKGMLPSLVTRLLRDGRLPRDLVIRGQLLAMSAATIDRLLRPVRARVSVHALAIT